MPRVVATAADGSILVDHEVPEDLVMRCVVEFAEKFPNLPIYIEGEMPVSYTHLTLPTSDLV